MPGHYLLFRRRRLILMLALMVVAFCGSHVDAALSNNERLLLSHLDASRAMQSVGYLSSDSLAGRRAGSQDQWKTVDYLVGALHGMGLSSLNAEGIDGFTQPLTMRYALVNSKDDINARITYTAPNASLKSLSLPYRSYNGNGGLDISSEVIFVGHGISDPESGYDDYAGVDVDGKIVLWLPGEPRGLKLARQHSAARKLLEAYQHGASACLLLKPAEVKDQWGTNVGLAGAIADFPYLAVDSRTAQGLFGRPADKLYTAPTGTRGITARIQITPVRDPRRRTANVLAEIRGSDPSLASEVVLVGAHFDHLGLQGAGRIFHGADDNASGTSVVLEIARAISEAELKPMRTIVFAFWTGEEAGLIGSTHFASHPPFALKSIVSSLQLDMVGQGTPGDFLTTGARAFPEHFADVDSAARDLGMVLRRDAVIGASDHLALVRRGVPTSLLSASGKHPNYHTVLDTASGIDRSVVESAARLTALAIWRAANPDT